MASGVHHNLGLCLISIVSSVTIAVSTGDLNAAALVGIGVLSGILLTPDLDINGPTVSHWFIGRSLGRLPQIIWTTLWWPYSQAIPHRSFISHAPILSTAFRLIYVHILIKILSFNHLQFLQPNVLLWWWIIGLMIADFTHWAMDQ